jgi:hypothetical protein
MFKGVNIAESYTYSTRFVTDQKCCYTLFITDTFISKKYILTSLAFIVAYIIKKQKQSVNLDFSIIICTFAIGNRSSFCSILES